MKTNVFEEAAGGSVGGGSIAASPLRLGDMRKRNSLKRNLVKFYSGVQNRYKVHDVVPVIKEFYDMSDVVSRLKGVENSDEDTADTITFGIEDDNGNIMKVSVKKDQAKEFEFKLARDMADMKDSKVSGDKENMSLAELLFNLKDEFDIVDAEFPDIPKDVVYNADKATVASKADKMASNTDNDDMSAADTQDMGQGGDDMDMGGDMGAAAGGDAGADDLGGDGTEGGDADMGDEDGSGEDMGDGSDEGDMGQGGDMGAAAGGGMGGNSDLDMDDQSVEDFDEAPKPATPESMLQAVMDMLKSDAEAKKAQADAAAEEARARQAEYAYKASQATVAHQEEIAQMEADMDRQKGKEKEAKKLANLAKHRVQRASSSMMGESILGQVIREMDDMETQQSIQKEMQTLKLKYAPQSTDNPDTLAQKKMMLVKEMKVLQDKMKVVMQRDQWLATMNRQQQQQQPNQQQQPMQNGQPQQNGAPAAPNMATQQRGQ
jgi:hypothetical protein